MFVGKNKGRQLARYIALMYIILWILFIIFMVVRFNLNELFDIDLIMPLIITTIVDISLSLIIYISSYKIENNNQLCILYSVICLFSIFWYFNWFGLILLILFIITIVIIKFGRDDSFKNLSGLD